MVGMTIRPPAAATSAIAANPANPATPGSWTLALAALLAAALPVALFLVAAPFLGGWRPLLAAVAGLLLVASVVGFSRYATARLAGERRATGRAVATAIADERSLAVEASGAAVPASEAAAWDADLFRRPRGLVTPEGEVDPARLALAQRADALRVERTATVASLLALVVLAFVGFGGASRVGRDARRVPRRLRLHAAGDDRHAGARLPPVHLRRRPLLHRLQHLQLRPADLPRSGSGSTTSSTSWATSTSPRAPPAGLVFNYQNFYWTLVFTVVWTITNVAFGVSVGLLLALILNTKGLALPVHLPGAPHPAVGDAELHHRAHLEGDVPPAVRGHQPGPPDARRAAGLLVRARRSPRSSTVLATNGWLCFPFMMVISLGALQSIPADLYEAARVDGASRWQQFRAITLPSLKPALVPAIILSVVWTFNMFNIIYLVTGGRAGARRPRSSSPRPTSSPSSSTATATPPPTRRSSSSSSSSTVSVQNRVTRATEGDLMAPARSASELPHLAAPRASSWSVAARSPSTRCSGWSTIAVLRHSRAWRYRRRARRTPTLRRPAAGRHRPGRDGLVDAPTSSSVFADQPFARWLAQQRHRGRGATTVVGVFLACTAAYAFSRFRFPGRRAGLMSFLVSQMFPGTLMLIPLYIIIVAVARAGLDPHRPGPRLRHDRDPVLRLDAEGLLRHHPEGARGGGADRRRLAGDDLLPHRPAARQARDRGHRALLVHDRLERVHPGRHLHGPGGRCTRRRSVCASSSAASRSSGATSPPARSSSRSRSSSLFLFLQKYLVSGLTAGSCQGLSSVAPRRNGGNL